MKKILSLGLAVLGLLQINAQVPTINETFDSFTAIPQNGWTGRFSSTAGNPPPMFLIDDQSGNKAIQTYAGGVVNADIYLVSPQIVAPDGSKTLSFQAAKSVGSAGNGTIEAGLVSNPTDMSTFVSLGTAVSLTSNTYQTINVNVPASTATYIVFKFHSVAPHTALQIDNVIYDSASMAVSETAASSDIKFAATADNNTLQFSSKNYTVSSVQIYSANGQKTLGGKTNNNTFDISGLKSGIYFIIIETTKGTLVKSKFLKK